MATDCDRCAGVLDKRFSSSAYLLTTGSQEAAESSAAYALRREREAEPELRDLFVRLLNVVRRERRSPRLPGMGDDSEIRSLRERAMQSKPGMRLIAAFDDAMRDGSDLAGAFAARSYNWMRGCLEVMNDWPGARHPFRDCESEFKRLLVGKIRRAFLHVGEPAEKSAPATQGQILETPFPVNT